MIRRKAAEVARVRGWSRGVENGDGGEKHRLQSRHNTDEGGETWPTTLGLHSAFNRDKQSNPRSLFFLYNLLLTLGGGKIAWP